LARQLGPAFRARDFVGDLFAFAEEIFLLRLVEVVDRQGGRFDVKHEFGHARFNRQAPIRAKEIIIFPGSAGVSPARLCLLIATCRRDAGAPRFSHSSLFYRVAEALFSSRWVPWVSKEFVFSPMSG
jgi:hypothetical protein